MAKKAIVLNIKETPEGYIARTEEFPDLVISAPTFGLCEALGIDAVNDARHQRDVTGPAEAAKEEAALKALEEAEVILRKRGRPRKVEPVVEGNDVE